MLLIVYFGNELIFEKLDLLGCLFAHTNMNAWIHASLYGERYLIHDACLVFKLVLQPSIT